MTPEQPKIEREVKEEWTTLFGPGNYLGVIRALRRSEESEEFISKFRLPTVTELMTSDKDLMGGSRWFWATEEAGDSTIIVRASFNNRTKPVVQDIGQFDMKEENYFFLIHQYLD